ncbi:hypothetical protein BDV06DRAFT_228074 [Aspergillus oleicola]
MFTPSYTESHEPRSSPSAPQNPMGSSGRKATPSTRSLASRSDNVVLVDKLGLRHEVQSEYWQRFKHAFALEANEFTDAVLNDKPVPVKLETGMTVMKIGQALQHAFLSGEVVKFDEKGERFN